jgi:two-component system chemotaxis response regulator CheB
MAQDLVRSDLLPLVAAVARRTAGPMSPAPQVTASTSEPGRRRMPVTAVVIGVSTGGPNALADLVPSLPADLSVPVLIVQHMPVLFTQMLAERLDRVANVAVVEAAESDAVVAGRVYIAPGGRHMAVRRTAMGVEVVLQDGPPENSCRPAADVLFRSAADVYGAGVVGVVLTGMGSDGLRGCELVRGAGGRVMVQDMESSVVPSMPAAVAGAGLADAVLPLGEIGPALVRWIAGEGP